MSGVRANWHLAELELGDSDPEPMQGQPIDLSRDVAEINAELTAALDKEARLAMYAGVSCDLKSDVMHRTGSHKPPCYTCPKFTDDPWEKRSVVCATGRRQADLADELIAAYAAERAARGAIAALEVTPEDEALDLIAAIEAEEAEELAALAL